MSRRNLLILLVVTVLIALLLPGILPKSIRGIVYIDDLAFFVIALLLVNSISLGESDLGVWGMMGLAIGLIILGVLFFFSSAFVPLGYNGYAAAFGIILVLVGCFAAFRSRRRRGQFIYVR